MEQPMSSGTTGRKKTKQISFFFEPNFFSIQSTSKALHTDIISLNLGHEGFSERVKFVLQGKEKAGNCQRQVFSHRPIFFVLKRQAPILLLYLGSGPLLINADGLFLLAHR